MAIRLAALDVDGTLLAPDNSITPATRQAIHEAKDAGLEIVVCTGRSFVEVQDILRQLPEVRYLSCGTGAYALDVWTMEMLYECSMPSELGKAAYRAVAQADCMVHFYTGLSVRHSRWCIMDHGEGKAPRYEILPIRSAINSGLFPDMEQTLTDAIAQLRAATASDYDSGK